MVIVLTSTSLVKSSMLQDWPLSAWYINHGTCLTSAIHRIMLTSISLVYHPWYSTDLYQPGMPSIVQVLASISPECQPWCQCWSHSAWYVIHVTILTFISLVCHTWYRTDLYQLGMSSMVHYWPPSACYIIHGTVLTSISLAFISGAIITSMSLVWHPWYSNDICQLGMPSMVPVLTSTSLLCHIWCRCWSLSARYISQGTRTDFCQHGKSSMAPVLTSISRLCHPWYK